MKSPENSKIRWVTLDSPVPSSLGKAWDTTRSIYPSQLGQILDNQYSKLPCPQVPEVPSKTEAVAGKPRPSLLLLQVRQTREVRVSSSVQCGVSALTVRWWGGSGPAARTDLIAFSVTLICARAVSTGRANVSWLEIIQNLKIIFPKTKSQNYFHLDEGWTLSGSWGGPSSVWRRNREGTDRAGCFLPQLQLL